MSCFTERMNGRCCKHRGQQKIEYDDIREENKVGHLPRESLVRNGCPVSPAKQSRWRGKREEGKKDNKG